MGTVYMVYWAITWWLDIGYFTYTIFFWPCCMAMWDLSSLTRDQTHAPCSRSIWSFNHWLPGMSLTSTVCENETPITKQHQTWLNSVMVQHRGCPSYQPAVLVTWKWGDSPRHLWEVYLKLTTEVFMNSQQVGKKRGLVNGVILFHKGTSEL